ncbi:MAG TPA: ABC transporter [Patescibacteria group bacterium]|nr:ABC transporter [Patescibacteria group bacterium]
MTARLLGLVLLLLVIVAPMRGSAADLLGRPDSPAPTAETTAAPTVLPEPLRGMVASLVSVQSHLNAELRAQMQLARRGDSLRPALAIIMVSFLYGVFHAVGPGHGKMVVGGYILSQRARLLHGLAMSGMAALVQALAAIAVVGILATVLEMGSRQIMEQAALLEEISYGGIICLGLWMAWGVVSGRVCCSHADGEAGHVHAQDHHDHDHGHAHDHGHDCGCSHGHAPAKPAPSANRTELISVLTAGAMVGLRPCSGAILVLLFTLANHIFLIGVIATLAMGVGVAITVSAVSLGALGLHRGLARLGGQHDMVATRVRQTVALGGAMAIVLFGAAQLLGLWQGLIQPLAG